ncbi:hypothetical protein TYRP_001127 [Tyrophagus putrescentiae]|nr:hypothetical protein TYRP_001127 [Tyrophagus putrescentiae]
MELQQPAHPLQPSPRKPIKVGFDENLNPNPESVSIRAQYRAQIVSAFAQHQATLRLIDGTFRKPLKAHLTPPQYQTLFGLVKPILSRYKTINRMITASATSENLEKVLKGIFTEKSVGKELEILSIQYTLNYYLKAVPMLNMLLQTEGGGADHCSPGHHSKLSSILHHSHQKAGHKLDELLESVTAFMAAYPPLLDCLLQETPIQSEQYCMLEATLNSVRASAKLVADAKEGLLLNADHYAALKVGKHRTNLLGKLFARTCQ